MEKYGDRRKTRRAVSVSYVLFYAYLGLGSYTANLIHRDSRSVIKVVRFGLNILCLPDEHAVELVEKQIARQHRDDQAL